KPCQGDLFDIAINRIIASLERGGDLLQRRLHPGHALVASAPERGLSLGWGAHQWCQSRGSSPSSLHTDRQIEQNSAKHAAARMEMMIIIGGSNEPEQTASEHRSTNWTSTCLPL